MARSRKVLHRDIIFCSIPHLAAGGKCVFACTCVLRHAGGEAWRPQAVSGSLWIPSQIPSGVSQEQQRSQNVFILASCLPGPVTEERADCLHATRAQLQASWRSAGPLGPFSEKPTGAWRGGKAKLLRSLGLNQDPNHAGLKTPHPQATSEELRGCCCGGRNSSWGRWGGRSCPVPREGEEPG